MSTTVTPRRRGRRRQQTLERVLGTPALFATAYGNVGSSIYYALGLVAGIALGLTPLVFLISGLDLRRYCRDVCGGHRSLSRGRRLLELRPPRIQRARFVRCGLGADAQLHHHDRHLGVLRPALPLDLLGPPAREPVGHRRRHARGHFPRALEHRRDQGSSPPEHLSRRARLRHAALAGRCRLRADFQLRRRLRRKPPLGCGTRRGASSSSPFRSR